MSEAVDFVRGALDELLASGERFPVLRVLCLARKAGLDLDRAARDALSDRLGISTERVERLASWSSVALQGRDDEGLRVCSGVSCRANGSEELHSWFLAEVDAERRVEEVHCLDNCDRGPSLCADGSLYSGSEEEVTLEERSWRRGPIPRG